jgi:PAS domain S-box-containing protein
MTHKREIARSLQQPACALVKKFAARQYLAVPAKRCIGDGAQGANARLLENGGMSFDFDRESFYWNVTPDLLVIFDDEGRFVHVNPAWTTTLGYQPEDLAGRVFLDLIYPEDLASTERAFARILQGEPILQFENRYLHADGSAVWLSWNAVPEATGFFCNARDVTAQKAQASLLATHEEEAKLREQFIAVLGHDLRNPLAAVDAALRLLRRDPAPADAVDLIGSAQGALARMSRLIDDVLDFARTRLGEGLAIDAARARALRPALTQTIEEIRLAHPDIRIDAEFAFADPVPCDPARIAQLLSNLLANAVTHGARGAPISVTARDEAGQFVLSVTNSGAPIPERVRHKLFQPFTRSDIRESQNGLGLGLFIARQIARAHDGTLDVVSDAKATRFTLAIPGGAQL